MLGRGAGGGAAEAQGTVVGLERAAGCATWRKKTGQQAELLREERKKQGPQGGRQRGRGLPAARPPGTREKLREVG